MAQTNVQAFSGDVAISSNLAVDTNTLFVDSVGNKVGIGTASPSYKLDVQGTGNFTGKLSLPIGVSSNPSLQLGTNTTYTDEQLYSLRWGGSGLLGMGLHSSTRGTFGKQGLLIHIPNTEEYSVKTNGWADIFSLDGATKKAYFGGNVGIGTASPDTLLHLEDSVPTIRFVDTDRVVDGNQQLGGIEFYSRDTTGSGYPNYELASIKCVNAANAASAPDGELTFSTGRHVGTGILEMMRINADGDVGIGTASPDYKLEVNGSFSATGPTTGASHGSASILYLLDTCFFKEWEYVNSLSPSVKVTFNTSTEIPDGAKAVLAEVYLSRDSLTDGDHQIHVLGKSHSANSTNWRSGAGQPSTAFSADVDVRQTVELLMPGESDGFTHYFGKWHSSVIIPLENNKIYYSNMGNSSSTGWVYVKIRGYYI